MGLLVKMLQEPKVGAKIRILLRKSEEEAANIPHDPATIKALIEKSASDDIEVHWSAIRQLTAIGAFAVPQLLDEALSNERMASGSRKLAAFTALRSMGTAATPPLIVALRCAGDAGADTLATLIAKNPDARAVPPLAAIAGNPARPENVRKAASDALAAIISEPARAAQLNAADAYFSLAQRYYYADPHLLELTSDAARGIWRWNPEGKNFAERLVFEPVSPAAYPRLMAAGAILAGMEQKHSSPGLIELYICNNYMMLEEAAALKDKAPDPQAVKTANEALGAEYLYLALGRALQDSNQPLARRCVEALASVGDPRPPRENTLVSAMTYPDKFVRIEAALALVQLSPMGELGGTAETVRVIAAALGAPVRPRVAVLTGDADLFQRLAKAAHGADLVFETQKATGDAVRRAKDPASPLSVLVIDARVEGDKTIAVVDSLHADVRSSRLPIILLAASDKVEKLQRRLQGARRRRDGPECRSGAGESGDRQCGRFLTRSGCRRGRARECHAGAPHSSGRGGSAAGHPVPDAGPQHRGSRFPEEPAERHADPGASSYRQSAPAGAPGPGFRDLRRLRRTGRGPARSRRDAPETARGEPAHKPSAASSASLADQRRGRTAADLRDSRSGSRIHSAGRTRGRVDRGGRDAGGAGSRRPETVANRPSLQP